ncbi:MAG TPA: hypothetical protein VIP51_12450 [Eoetvoesiella sp.]
MSKLNTHLPESTNGLLPKSRLWRYAGIFAVLAIMALAFAGYSLPELQVQWANFVALCSSAL